MYSYFFVPGYKLHKIDYILSLGPDEIIIDLEDAIKASDREKILTELISNTKYQKFYIRVPLYNISSGIIDSEILFQLLKTGFKKFVFPKIVSADDFSILYKCFCSFSPQIILLIETPRLLFEAKDLLLKYKKYFIGVAPGSHDFMNIVGGKYTIANLEYLRLNTLYLARMVDILAIDIASMELNEIVTIRDEIKDGVNKGFDAKFYIHPKQIEIYKQMDLYSREEYEWAIKVNQAFENVMKEKEEFNPVIINGEIIEKPHLKRAKKILNYYNHESF